MVERRRTQKAADHAIATNGSYCDIAVRRSGNCAEVIVRLVDDERRLVGLSKLGRARVGQGLAWSHRERAYLGVCQRLTAGAAALERAGS